MNKTIKYTLDYSISNELMEIGDTVLIGDDATGYRVSYARSESCVSGYMINDWENVKIHIVSDEEIKSGDTVLLPNKEIKIMTELDMLDYLSSESNAVKKIIGLATNDVIYSLEVEEINIYDEIKYDGMKIKTKQEETKSFNEFSKKLKADQIAKKMAKDERRKEKKIDNIKRESEKRIKEQEDNKKRMKIHLDYGKLFKEQLSETWQSNTETNYVIHVGKTNSGKTYNALQRLKEVGGGIYLAPLRLLAWEVYDRLNNEGSRCSLVTGEEQIEYSNAKITSATIEMASYSKEYEMAIIDESFMIGDKDRGKSWLNAMLNIKAKEIHIIINEEALELVTKILDLTDRGYEIKKYEMLQKFKFAEKNFIFSKNIPKRGVFVTFSRINVLINKMKIENLGFNVSALYGNLPPEIKKKQIEDFIEGRTDMLVTTDVIGMGINVPCDYIIFLETEKFDGITNRALNSMEVRQIAGRTGRYGLSNEDSFVSSVNSQQLKFIKGKYQENYTVRLAYFGLTYEIFSSFPEDMLIKDRINYFKNIDFIPSRLKGIVLKEDVQKYLSIESLIEVHKFDLKTAWHLLTAPTKYNNEEYFKGLIHYYAQNKTLKLPHIQNDYLEAKSLEDVISEVELYLNLTRHLNHDSDKTEKIKKDKEMLIEKLTTILLDKKLARKKSCKLCPTLLDITYPYGYCKDCYNKKFRSRYTYNYNDFDDDDDYMYK